MTTDGRSQSNFRLVLSIYIFEKYEILYYWIYKRTYILKLNLFTFFIVDLIFVSRALLRLIQNRTVDFIGYNIFA